MQLPSLSNWWGKREVPARQAAEEDPVQSLHREITRAFGSFWHALESGPGPGFGFPELAASPRAELTETGRAVEARFELPGLDEKNIEVSVGSGLLTVKAEMTSESDRRRGGASVSERSYGLIQRTVSLPPGVDADHATARYRLGVLTVTVPKLPTAEAEVKRIEVKKGS